MKIPRLSFNAGEVSPVLWYRSDIAKYRSSCQKIENFMNLPQGGVRRRYGTTQEFKFDGVFSQATKARVISWEVDRNTYFQLCFVSNEILIFNSDGGLVDTVGSVPYSSDDLQDIYYKQVYDVMYICHENHPMQELRRTASTTWSLSDYEFSPAPMQDANNSTITLNPDFNGGTITASSALFTSADVGRWVKIANDSKLSDSGNYDENSQGTTSTPLLATGVVTMRTEGGIWDGVLELQKQVGSGEWQTIGSVTSEDGNHNGEILRDIDEFDTRVRVNMASRGTTPNDSGCKWTLQIEEQQYSYYEITGYTSATLVNATRISGENADATTDWSLGALGGNNGYNTCVEIHEERMIIAGILGTPATVYGSKINDWKNFATGTLATSAFRFTLSADVRNRTRWLSTEKSLIMGTDYGEWSVGSRDGSTALSGENVVAQRQSQYGSASTQSVSGSDMTLYIEAGRKRVRSMTYNFAEKDGYVSADMNILAPHLTEDYGFVRLAYSRVPEQVIWCLREDGLVCCFNYDREQQVTAWGRHPMGGKVIDMNSFLTDQGDVINLLVLRSDGLYFETIQPDNICLDWHKTFDMEADYVASVNGNENFTLYDDSLAPSQQAKSSQDYTQYWNKSCFVRVINPPTDLVIKDSGEDVPDEDIIDMGHNMYWLPTVEDKSNITVYDFTTPLIPVTDYVTFENDPQVSSEVQCVEIINDAVDINNVDIFVGATPLTEDEDYFVMNNIRQILVIGETGTLIPKIGGSNLSDDTFTTFVPSQNFSRGLTDVMHIGIPYDSILQTTEITNSAQSGAGMTARVSELDVFLYKSVGGDISVDNGESFTPILQTSKNTIAGERIPEFTGKKDVYTMQGFSDEQTVIIKNNTAYNSTIASIGAYTKGLRQ